jgi:hypothetical protein
MDKRKKQWSSKPSPLIHSHYHLTEMPSRSSSTERLVGHTMTTGVPSIEPSLVKEVQTEELDSSPQLPTRSPSPFSLIDWVGQLNVLRAFAGQTLSPYTESPIPSEPARSATSVAHTALLESLVVTGSVRPVTHTTLLESLVTPGPGRPMTHAFILDDLVQSIATAHQHPPVPAPPPISTISPDYEESGREYCGRCRQPKKYDPVRWRQGLTDGRSCQCNKKAPLVVNTPQTPVSRDLSHQRFDDRGTPPSTTGPVSDDPPFTVSDDRWKSLISPWWKDDTSSLESSHEDWTMSPDDWNGSQSFNHNSTTRTSCGPPPS